MDGFEQLELSDGRGGRTAQETVGAFQDTAAPCLAELHRWGEPEADHVPQPTPLTVRRFFRHSMTRHHS